MHCLCGASSKVSRPLCSLPYVTAEDLLAFRSRIALLIAKTAELRNRAWHSFCNIEASFGRLKQFQIQPELHWTIAVQTVLDIEKREETAKRWILRTTMPAYGGGCHPLRQTGNGSVDESRNLFHWCKNPQGVSKLVIRLPIRERDTKLINAPPAITDASKDDPGAQDQGTISI